MGRLSGVALVSGEDGVAVPGGPLRDVAAPALESQLPRRVLTGPRSCLHPSLRPADGRTDGQWPYRRSSLLPGALSEALPTGLGPPSFASCCRLCTDTSLCFTLFYLRNDFPLWPHLQHLEVPRLGVQSELQLLASTTAHSSAGSLTH